jgi:hypothetical protein
MNVPFLQDTTFTGLISTRDYSTSQEWSQAYSLIQSNSAAWNNDTKSLWGSISGTLSAQSDLWLYLSAETFSPSQLTAFLVSNSISLCSIDVKGSLLSAGTDLFDIFLTSETDSQTLTYLPSSYELSISNGNTVNLSSINSLLGSVSGKYEDVYTTVQSNSAEWEQAYSITTEYQSTSGFFATNTALNAVSSILLPTTTYQNASGNWQDTFTNVQSNSANWILDGGNNKGSDITIGTNDAYSLKLESNAATRVTLLSSGLITLQGSVSGLDNPTTSFNQGQATGQYSFAENLGQATGSYSHAEGDSTLASGVDSHAEGIFTAATGEGSHAEGYRTATGERVR